MNHAKPLLYASLLAVMFAPGSVAFAQQAPSDRDDAALAYAQCVRGNGYAEFPDPEPDGFRFLIAPDDVARFKKAAAACQDIAPDGMRDEGITPEALDALLKLAQCVRENGITEFPDPTADGRFDLGGTGLGPGDTRLDAAMTACRQEAGGNVQITIGG